MDGYSTQGLTHICTCSLASFLVAFFFLYSFSCSLIFLKDSLRHHTNFISILELYTSVHLCLWRYIFSAFSVGFYMDQWKGFLLQTWNQLTFWLLLEVRKLLFSRNVSWFQVCNRKLSFPSSRYQKTFFLNALLFVRIEGYVTIHFHIVQVSSLGHWSPLQSFP